MSFDRCPRCGGPVTMEKDTFSGNVMRGYSCSKCPWQETVDEGPALWKILSDDAEKKDSENA